MSRKSSLMDVSDSPARRRGPKPLLSTDLESQLVHWVLTRQSSGRRVSRDDVITQAQEMLRRHEEVKTVGMGWCNRFVARHPELNLRSGGGSSVKKNNLTTNEELVVKITLRDNALPDEAENNRQVEDLKALDAGVEEESGEKEVKSRKYNRKHMEAAVEMYLAGRPMSEVTQRFPLLHQRTIRRRVLRVQRGEVDRRRGPRPLLEGEPEQELVTWILDMQSRGTRVTKHDILARANEKYRALNGGESGEDKLKEGWLRRFKERHPVLSGRALGKERNEKTGELDTKENTNSGHGEILNGTPPSDGQLKLIAETERLSSQLNRSDPGASGAEDAATSFKRQKSEVNSPACSSAKAARSSGSTRRGSILPERHQSEKDDNVRKIDAIMQSNQRLEEMQRQQLEMLKQLCASKNVPIESQQNIEDSSTKQSPSL